MENIQISIVLKNIHRVYSLFWCTCTTYIEMHTQDVDFEATGFLYRNAITSTYNDGIQYNYRNPVAHTASVKVMTKLTAGCFSFDHFTLRKPKTPTKCTIEEIVQWRRKTLFAMAITINGCEQSISVSLGVLARGKFIEVVFKA